MQTYDIFFIIQSPAGMPGKGMTQQDISDIEKRKKVDDDFFYSISVTLISKKSSYIVISPKYTLSDCRLLSAATKAQ